MVPLPLRWNTLASSGKFLTYISESHYLRSVFSRQKMPLPANMAGIKYSGQYSATVASYMSGTNPKIIFQERLIAKNTTIYIT